MHRPNPSLALRDVAAPPPPLRQAKRTMRFLDALKRVVDGENPQHSLVEALDTLLMAGGFVCQEGRYAPGPDEAGVAKRAVDYVASFAPSFLPTVCPVVIAQGMDAASRLVDHVWHYWEWHCLDPDERFEIVGMITVLRNAAENAALQRDIRDCIARQRAEARRQHEWEVARGFH